MIRWRFYDPSPMRDLLEQMIQAAGRPAAPAGGRGEPMPINVHQTATEVVVEAALPGVAPDAIDIDFTDGVLTLRARTEFAERDYLHQEMHSLEFMRQIALPVECRWEEASADFEQGILEIRIPKQRRQQPEKIRIQVNRKSEGGTTIEAQRGKGYEVSEGKPARNTGARPKES